MTSYTEQPSAHYDDLRMMLLATIITLLTVGVILLIFSAAYVEDTEVLKSAPETIWGFICGIPVENDIVLPLLLTLAILAFLSSFILQGMRWWLWRQDHQKLKRNG